MAGEESLAAASGHTEAHVRHTRREARGLDGDVRDGRGVVAKLHRLESGLGPPVLRALAQEIAQRVENPRLVILKGDHETLIS
jgi:hypothetical protein